MTRPCAYPCNASLSQPGRGGGGHGTHALRILGKLGGRNRRFLAAGPTGLAHKVPPFPDARPVDVLCREHFCGRVGSELFREETRGSERGGFWLTLWALRLSEWGLLLSVELQI